MDLSLDYLQRWLSANRRDNIDWPSAVAFAVTLFWFAANLASPFMVPPGSIDLGNDGVVGAGDNSPEISRINNTLARLVYESGDSNCHQRSDRSFALNGNQMPFCARCTAIFLGLVIGAGIMMFFKLELNIIWIILGLVPMAVDGGVQMFLPGYESTNTLRVITGALAGAVTGIAIGYIVSEMSNIAVSRSRLKRGSR